MEKQLPTLPDNVAKEYESLVVPGVVIIQQPNRRKRKIDLKKISLEDAAKLAEQGLYLVKKEKPAPVKSAKPESKPTEKFDKKNDK